MSKKSIMMQKLNCIALQINVLGLVCIINSTSEIVNSYIPSQCLSEIWELYPYGPNGQKISYTSELQKG